MEYSKFVQELEKQIYPFHIEKNFSNIVIFCVGTNKIIGDCVGPMTGQQLGNILKDNKNIMIYGNMQETLNFKNAKRVIENVLREYKNPFIITIDAALGKEEMIEKIVINGGKIQIGNSLGRSICYDSHINIKGVVGKHKNTPIENIETLRKVQPELVMELSNIVVYGLNKIIQKIGITY